MLYFLHYLKDASIFFNLFHIILYKVCSKKFFKKTSNFRSSAKNSRGFEHAVIKKGTKVGTYDGTRELTLERDDRFPIRCTVQYYNVTDVKEITETQMSEIAKMIKSIENFIM